jgi:hypothetical protein
MASHRLGQPEEARAYFADLRAWISEDLSSMKSPEIATLVGETEMLLRPSNGSKAPAAK